MSTNPNMEAIQTITVGAGGAASIEFINIPQTYTDLHLLVSIREESSTASVAFIKFNNATANRSERYLQGNGSSAVSGTTSVLQFIACQPSDTANTFGNASIYIPNYTSSNFKSVSSDSVSENNATGAFIRLVAGLWSDTSAINQITITTDTGDVAQYSSATLYGVTKFAEDSPKAVGGAVTEDSSYYYHTFKSSGNFIPTQSLTADYFIVAGGGGANAYSGGGGGAGGFRAFTSASLTATNYNVTVGAGGAVGTQGGTSTFNSNSSSGGGSGTNGGGGPGGNGGSGGGAGGQNSSNSSGGSGNSGSYTPVEGYAGAGNNLQAGGGGGGAAEAAPAVSSSSVTGRGGDGTSAYSSWGAATNTGQLVSGSYYYAGGGAGGMVGTGRTASRGGYGGGGASSTATGTAGTASTGGGGGGGTDAAGTGSTGGSGLVIIRYAK